MSAPLFALSKNKRTRIEWEGHSGQRALVTAPEDTGIASVWDYGVLLWAVSQINEAVTLVRANSLCREGPHIPAYSLVEMGT
jgi:plasmid replication initiation protein